MQIEEKKNAKLELRELISYCIRINYYIGKFQFYSAMLQSCSFFELLSEKMEQLEKCIYEYAEDAEMELRYFLEMIHQLQEAQEEENYIWMSDLYDLQLLPFFQKYLENICMEFGTYVEEQQVIKNIRMGWEKDRNLLSSLFESEIIEEAIKQDTFSDPVFESLMKTLDQILQKGYFIEETSSGFETLAKNVDNKKVYFHTNGQITREACMLAEEWLQQGKMQYQFYGLGFGYAYAEMFRMNDTIEIEVFETNRALLFLAFIFAPLDVLYQSERFTLVYDPRGNRMVKEGIQIEKDKGFYIFYPALAGIENNSLKEQLERYFVEESSVRGQTRQLEGNFRKNISTGCRSIEEVKKKFRGRDVIIVAAGPSLEKNIKQLPEAKEKGKIILCAGTVLKRLMSEKIIPDYVIITDSGMGTYAQIEGIEDTQVPMLVLSTVCSKIVTNYHGTKYLLCQKGLEMAEAAAKQNQWSMVETGGSVMTTAFDFCLHADVKSIIFVGLDLAFIGGQDHVSGTAYCNQITNDRTVMVEDIYGKQVPTSKNLKIYKEWIENRIQRRSEKEKKISLIDATEGGAKIEGMMIKALKEVL